MKYQVLFVLTVLMSGLYAQENLDQKVLFSVEDEEVTAGEYMAVYNKNRDVGQEIDPKTPAEYLDLYINFKLKVHEAKKSGLDTLKQFKYEYNNYYDQLAKPYLSDNKKSDELVREAYERSKYDVRASHIMIKVPESSRDTAEAFKIIKSIQKQIADDGGNFSLLAEEYSEDDYSAKKGGDLGYFTVFSMVYPFESAAYNTPVGEVSEIIRSQFGYHIVMVTDKRPARGKVGVSHIMLTASEKDPAKEKEAKAKIDEIYTKLNGGADFAQLAEQYSEDQTSSQTGGRLNPFGINRMYPAFEEAAFDLENEGDISEPVRTPVGWHILKLNKKINIPNFEEGKSKLTNKVQKDSRAQQSTTSILRRLKKEYKFKEDLKSIQKAVSMVDISYMSKKFEKPESKANEMDLFGFADKKYTIGDFMEYLISAQRKNRVRDLESAVYNAYETYSEKMILDYEKTKLADKYSEFKMLSREYYEGILLFNITNDVVWKKAMKDTVGLKSFFADHRSDYMWDKRYDMVIGTASSAKNAKKASKMIKKGASVEEVEAKLNEDSQLNISLKEGVFEEGELEVMSRFEMTNTGVSKVVSNGENYEFIAIDEILEPSQKELKEARGSVISGYQDYLEQEWLASLKKKFEITIDDQVLEQTIEALN